VGRLGSRGSNQKVQSNRKGYVLPCAATKHLKISLKFPRLLVEHPIEEFKDLIRSEFNNAAPTLQPIPNLDEYVLHLQYPISPSSVARRVQLHKTEILHVISDDFRRIISIFNEIDDRIKCDSAYYGYVVNRRSFSRLYL